MTVSVLIVTHDNVGSALLNTVTKTLGKLPIPTIAVPINNDCEPEVNLEKLKVLLSEIKTDDGVLVLTDLFGSTPSNLASALQAKISIKVVSGVNLPMLIRVMNYPQLNLASLAEKAISGGRDGVLNCAECA